MGNCHAKIPDTASNMIPRANQSAVLSTGEEDRTGVVPPPTLV